MRESKMRRIVALLLALMLLGILAGCSGNESPSESSTTESISSQNPFQQNEENPINMGAISHGSRNINLDENERLLPLVYQGEEVYFEYYVNAIGNAKNVGFLMFIDGIPQPYRIDSIDAPNEYMHIFNLESDNIDLPFTFIFSPVIGNQGDDLSVSIISIYNPSFRPDMDKTTSYGGYHEILPAAYTLHFETDAEPLDVTSDTVYGTVSLSNMQFYSEYGNEYLYRENEAIAKLFSGRAVSDFAYTEMYQYYLEYDFSALLVILICLYGLVGVFVSEKEADMDTLLLTTISGGKKTVVAKIIASAFFIVAVCMWFWVLDFAAFSVSFNSLEAAALPLYALQNFEYASVNLTLGQFAILSAGIKTLGMLVIGMSGLLISSKSKNALLPFAMSLVLSVGIILFQEMAAGSGNVLIKVLNPFVLVANSELFRKIEFINIFGTPILSYVMAMLFAAILGGVLTVMLMASARKSTIAMRK